MALANPPDQDFTGIVSPSSGGEFWSGFPGGDKENVEEGSTPIARQFYVDINGAGGAIGVRPQHPTGILSGKDVFTSDAGTAEYTNERAFNGASVIKTVAPMGSTGFGSFGGIYTLSGGSKGRQLVRGDELWTRTTLMIPTGFEYNVNGRNKFQRVRVKHPVDVSEGYNDLYIDGGDVSPWDFIFEGEQQWLLSDVVGTELIPEQWHTVETYLKFDHLKGNEGGVATVKVWFDDKLIINSTARRTMNQIDSFVSDVYLFTYWDDATPTSDRTVYIAQQLISSIRPTKTDAVGNPYHGRAGGAL